ncbi:MAG: hypothetical protein J0I06_12025 [Planctomycetes bacterium]|nr:hypothetical protein [Planctomycetota bacterium]
MVLNQQLLNADPARTEPVHTFGRHNSKHAGSGADPLPANTFVPSNPNAMPAVTSASLSDTLMTPFDWLPQMDRMLVNEIELFQVRDTPPHLVPENFLQATAIPPAPAPAPGVTYELGSAQWRFTDNGVGRALEYLTVKPFTAGVAHGGRVPGKVNVNAIPDKRVLNGLLDPQPGNAFNAAFVNNNAWNVWMASRNGVTTRTLATGGTAMTTDTPGQSVLDGTGGTSRPFLSFGAPAVAGIGPGGFAYTGGGGESLTVLRSDGSPVPQLYTTLPAYGATYFGPEPLRKMMNNITTVNHTYLVFLTIGYFELDGQNTVDLGGGVTMPRLAHEACLSVPGDMRQKFVAVIDMSGMAINQTARQYFTTLEQTAYAGATTLLVATDANGNAVATDGTTVAIGGTLYLGYGAEEQVVSVQSVTPVTVNNGVNSVVMGQVTLAAPLTRTAWGGSSVSNVRPGYPGVQPGFKYSDPNYKPVLPYIERIK